MGHLLGAVDQSKLDEQRGVVQNEKRQGDNAPYGKAFETIITNLFPPGELAAQILERLSADYGEPAPAITEAAMAALQAHPFPGNVRELENVLERAFTLCEGGRIRAEDLQLGASATATPRVPVGVAATPASVDPAAEPGAAGQGPLVWELPDGESLESFLEKIERALITEALDATRWNKTAAAKQLGITFRAQRYRRKKLNLE
jgi:two-component system response regulator PilR (NtrC family)